MRDPKRIPIILENLQVLWSSHEDMSLGQLLENYVFTRVVTDSNGMPIGVAIFYQEDDETLENLKAANSNTNSNLSIADRLSPSAKKLYDKRMGGNK